MAGLSHRVIATNGIRMHIAEQGSGPLVVLLHGFPESWYSWRHQLAALAAAGLPHLRAIVPNLRDTVVLPGCGHWTQQERPAEVNAAILAFVRGLEETATTM